MKKQTCGTLPIPLMSTLYVLALRPAVVSAEDLPQPVDQAALNALVPEDRNADFLHAFEAGDELSEVAFTAEHGVGARIGEGRRFTRVPRADLNAPGEWASHFPTRESGANATSCIACHNAPVANGAGDVALNVIVDPAHTGDPSLYLERNTLPLFALGVPQKLAEEISTDLRAQRDAARGRACRVGEALAMLSSRGVDFGSLRVTRTGAEPCQLTVNSTDLAGIGADLVIRPFGWKGNHATIRAFTRDAAHNEFGMQAVELVGAEDRDHDGVTHELSVGDMTALTVYMAALDRPVTTLELAELGLVDLSDEQRTDIAAGERLFGTVGCVARHTPSMTIEEPVFREPSATPGYHDETFPDGSAPGSHGLMQGQAIAFDLTADQPNNRIETRDGKQRLLGALERDATGQAVAHWYTDFRRHDIGPGLADPDDPLGLGASMFLTRSLAGVGATGPWLHDGRATTLHEAISVHGGEAADSAVRYTRVPEAEQQQIVAFLENLVIYKAPEDVAH